MNELYNFHAGTKVLWDLRDGRKVEGEVLYVTSAGNIGVQWQDEPEGTVHDYHYSEKLLSVLVKDKQQSNAEVKNTEANKDSTEDRIKELIVHLVQINQTELACCTIDILQKYTHNTKALEFIERNT